MRNSTSNLKRKDKKTAKRNSCKNLISQAEYARRRGVSFFAINKHVKKGTITLVNRLIDPDKADEQLRSNMDLSQRCKVIGEGEEAGSIRFTFNKARTVEKGYQAKLAELNYKEKVGELIKAKDVEVIAFSTYRKFRDQMLNIPDRISAIVAGESDIKVCHGIILKEIEKGLKKTQDGCIAN